ncbi:PspC domain-containing protein [Buchananella hordeovulneris]|uniref:Phage shock protein PspC N-terminal domain-containing protein n=1 Tax=Buchananella hordeovulneris TaxID=52770 RepID=A0A1Q5PZ35_9ACTO|nr:PspC domain-containing protein [Buchananella hordeovulneris]OKL52797.1 hypothetical protein BSZ40_01460 [Buchananella hordeovulneris]
MSYQASPTGVSRFFAQLRQLGLARTTDRWVGGVAGALARRINLDAALVRLIVALLVLFGGVGLLAYGLAWLLLPEEEDGRIHLEELTLGRWSSGAIGALVTCFCGLPWGLSVFFPWSWPFVVALTVLAVILIVRDQQQPVRHFTPGPAPVGGPSGDPSWRAATYEAPRTGAAPTAAAAAGTPNTAAASVADDDQAGAAPAAAPFDTASYPTGAASGAPAQWGVPRPPQPWRTRVITKPHVAQVGSAHTLLTMGLGFLAAAGAYWLGNGYFQSAMWAIAALTVVLGLGLAVAALRGRRSGTLTTLSVLFTAFVVAPAGLVSLTASPRLLAATNESPLMLFSHSTTLRSHASLFGQHDLHFTGTERLDAPLTVATWAGEINLEVPEGYPIEIHTEIGLGEIEARIFEDQTMVAQDSAPSKFSRWLIDEVDFATDRDWDDDRDWEDNNFHRPVGNRHLRFNGSGAHVLRLGEGKPRAVVYLTGGVGEIKVHQFRK